jgi:hypothetical protein
MRVLLRALALGWACVSLLAGAASAEEWALGAVTPDGRFEVDVSTIEVRQEVVKSWLRETLGAPPGTSGPTRPMW